MKFPGFCGPAYRSQSLSADAQMLMNWYLEKIESGDGNNQFALYPSPGTKTFIALNPISPPAHPPVIYESQLVNRTGIISGNTITGTFNNPPTVQVGDTIIISFFMLLVPNTHVVNGISVTFGGNPIGAFTQIGPALTFSSGLNLSAMVHFYCTVTTPFPTGSTLGFVWTFNGPAQNADFQMAWSYIRNVTTVDVDQITTQTFTNTTSFNAPPLTITDYRMILSFIRTSVGGAAADTVPPFHLFTTTIAGEGLYNLGPNNDGVSPPGTYQPVWNSTFGSQDAGVINFCFKFK